MNAEVTAYIEKINQPWQVEVCNQLRQIIWQTIPDVTERIQYAKPHYLKNGKYACVFATAKGWVSLTIFNATDLTAPDGYFEEGTPERKTIKIREGQAIDYGFLGQLIQQASSTI